MRDQTIREITRVACKLHQERGIPYKQACLMASRAAVRASRRRPGEGMGQSTAEALKQAAELAPIKAAREALSPWLWIFSLAGFGMALLNTSRIKRVYKRQARAAA